MRTLTRTFGYCSDIVFSNFLGNGAHDSHEPLPVLSPTCHPINRPTIRHTTPTHHTAPTACPEVIRNAIFEATA